MSVGQLLQVVTLKSNRYLGLWFHSARHRAYALSDSIPDYCWARQKHRTQMTHNAIGRPFSHSSPPQKALSPMQFIKCFLPLSNFHVAPHRNSWINYDYYFWWVEEKRIRLCLRHCEYKANSGRFDGPFRTEAKAINEKQLVECLITHNRMSGKCWIRSSCSNRNDRHSLDRFDPHSFAQRHILTAG